MKTCATCAFWKAPEDYETSAKSLGLRKCTAVPMFWDATEWSEDGDARQFRAEFKDTKAFAQDGSDYRAELWTKGDFGCVMHSDV
jgi:hypothetical protein